MTLLTERRLRRYERLMRSPQKILEKMPEDYLCEGCIYHRPRWKYRFCRFPECREMKGMKTFRTEGWEELEFAKPCN